MPLDPGAMRARVEIWRHYTNPSDWENPEGYAFHRTIWARVQYRSGREFRETGIAVAEHLATFSARWRHDLDQADRLKFDGQWWDIISIVPVGFKAGVDINAKSIGPAE